MKIGVVSDTHIRTSKELETFKKIFFEQFSNIDLILHAGDLVSLQVFEWLNEQVKTIAVKGNMDFPQVAEVLPQSEVVQVGKLRIGLTHGWGPPSGLIERTKNVFAGPDGDIELDCIVFGHTHSAFAKVIGNLLFFNPGAPTDKRFAPYNSVGFLEINDEIEGRIVRI